MSLPLEFFSIVNQTRERATIEYSSWKWFTPQKCKGEIASLVG
jgi:hypothetical protein